MTEDEFSYLYKKYNEHKTKFANGEFTPPKGSAKLGYATNLRYMRRDRNLEQIARYYAHQCSDNLYFNEKYDERFVTEKRTVTTFVKEPFKNNKALIDKLLDSIKGMVEGNNNTADDIHSNCKLSYGLGDKDIAYVGCGIATGDIKYFPEFRGDTHLYIITCIYGPFVPKTQCYDWSKEQKQLCADCPPDASPCRKSLCV